MSFLVRCQPFVMLFRNEQFGMEIAVSKLHLVYFVFVVSSWGFLKKWKFGWEEEGGGALGVWEVQSVGGVKNSIYPLGWGCIFSGITQCISMKMCIWLGYLILQLSGGQNFSQKQLGKQNVFFCNWWKFCLKDCSSQKQCHSSLSASKLPFFAIQANLIL